jgi:hypothetical protein
MSVLPDPVKYIKYRARTHIYIAYQFLAEDVALENLNGLKAATAKFRLCKHFVIILI